MRSAGLRARLLVAPAALVVWAAILLDADVRHAAQASRSAQDAPRPFGTWSKIMSAPADGGPHDVAVADADHAWTIGHERNTLFWNGETWASASHPAGVYGDLDVVVALDAEHAWIAGNQQAIVGGSTGRKGYVWRWDGTGWVPDVDDVPMRVHDLVMLRPDYGLAVGEVLTGGDAASFRIDERGWTRLTIWPIEVGDGVDVLSTVSAWAVGRARGYWVTRFDGSAWTAMPNWWAAPSPRAIDMVDESFGVIVGQDGAILHWDGARWAIVASPTSRVLTDVAMVSRTDGWAVGEDGMLHWDGQTWQLVKLPTLHPMRAVAMAGPDVGWAISTWGEVLRYFPDRPGSTVMPPTAFPSMTPLPAPRESTTPRPTSSYTPEPTATSVPAVIHLPVLHRHHPALPYKPVLHPIANLDGDGFYTVQWQPALLAETYTLEEDEDLAFGSPTAVFTGPSTFFTVAGHRLGLYHYRVRGRSALGEGAWSEPASVEVGLPKRIEAVADADVIEQFDDANTGTENNMWAGFHAKGCFDIEDMDVGTVRSLVRFDLASVPRGTSIRRVVLHLTTIGACWGADGDGQWRDVTVLRSDGAWEEAAVTWRNRPKEREAVGTGRLHASDAVLGPVAIDVTAIARRWIDGAAPNHGLWVRGPESNDRRQFFIAAFATHEWASADERPFLTIDYGPPLGFDTAEGGLTPVRLSVDTTAPRRLTFGRASHTRRTLPPRIAGPKDVEPCPLPAVPVDR